MAASIIAALGLAMGAVGTGVGAANASAANATQAAIGRAGTQNALNQQQYQQALNTIALQRSVAGQTDGRGDTTTYDPATNSWKTTLSREGARLQAANDQATISRDTTDLATSQEANNNAMRDAIAARTAAGPALSAIQNFKPMSAQGLEGDLQQTATTANRQAEDPIIADTLRSFARNGTAAGPALTNMMRDNATTLRTTMLNDKIAAMKNVGDINNQQRQGLNSTYQTLNNASRPSLNFSPIANSDPNAALAAEVTQRATGAPTSASQGAYSTGMGTNATNTALEYSANHPGVSNLGASIVGMSGQVQSAFAPNGVLGSWLNSGAGNKGDQSAYQRVNDGSGFN